jgi:coenzyme F420-0:L-glutamate ligase / coenzyme F420-1:gamma-L-glutamate ligase
VNLPSFSAVALPNIPLIQAGDDLVEVIGASMQQASLSLVTDDVLVISSKIVSKSEGRIVPLEDVLPSLQAIEYAEKAAKDPRIVELVLQESRLVSRVSRGVLVTEHRLGFVSANAGIDQSNVENSADRVLLLPQNPDQTAHDIRQRLLEKTGVQVAVIISDTHGRPFRFGNIGVAIGVAGMLALTDLRGQKDLFGRELQITQQGYADLVASAAHLLCGEADEGRPVILVRGLQLPHGDGKAQDLNRPADKDLYR